MKDLKIKVENNLDEIAELLKQYGCKHFSMTCSVRNYVLLEKGVTHFCKLKSSFKDSKAREVNIGQLRDLVVLKRNDVEDKTHCCDSTNSDYFVSSGNIVYFFDDEKTNSWKTSNYDLSELKPIEKNMKEWLNKETYEYKKAVDMGGHSKWIEIPEGAAQAVYSDDEGLSFAKHDSGSVLIWSIKTDSDWCVTKWIDWDEFTSYGFKVVWQRATHPEELPFVDGEPSINDKYAEIEQVRQSIIHPPAYFGNAIRPKPRQRVYAVMGDDDCIRVPSLTADYLFNTVQTLGFASEEQKGAVLYHLNYLKVWNHVTR